MPKELVVDSSTLIALERAKIINLLSRINYEIIIPPAVRTEVNNDETIEIARITELRGKTLKKSRSLGKLGIGKGEAQCCALAYKLKKDFIVCDDVKFLRQKFFSSDSELREITILGFSFLIHLIYKKKLIGDVWECFNKVIKLNNCNRSEVYVANYTFLKELKY